MTPACRWRVAFGKPRASSQSANAPSGGGPAPPLPANAASPPLLAAMHVRAQWLAATGGRRRNTEGPWVSFDALEVGASSEKAGDRRQDMHPTPPRRALRRAATGVWLWGPGCAALAALEG
ncbi:MAG: hypothetical protein WDW36_000398 [Sanguina aurantia]